MSTKRERAEIISRLAFEMAQSGEYDGYQAIEHALRAQGYSEARGELDHGATRQLLDEICESSRGENNNASRS
jgi:hypothetical protein